jgi:tetratricopeptide (TPR) repeat protein
MMVSCAGLGTRSQAQEEFDTGLALFNQGRHAEAIPHLDRATRLMPEFGRAYLYLGRSYLSLGKWKEALPSLSTACRLSPDESRQEVLNILLDLLFSAALSNQGESARDAASLLREMLNPGPNIDRPE